MSSQSNGLDGSRHSRNGASPRHALDGSRHSRGSRNASPRNATPRRITPPFPLSSGPTSPTQAARQKLPWLLAGLVGLCVAASAVDFGGKVWAHAGRSAAVRRALDTGKRDAAASQRSSFLRLLALGLPLVLLCVGAAAMGSRALLCVESIESKLDRSQASEQKYKRLLLNWAPLSAWVGAVASDDDAIEDAAGDDAAMRKAKTLARLQKSF